MKQNRIGVFACSFRWIAGLTNAAATMDEYFLEALVLGTHGIAVSQMPLTENSGSVACGFQHLSDGDLFRLHHGSSDVSIDSTRAIVIAARHQVGPSRRTDGTHIKTAHPRAAGCHLVEVRSIENFISQKSIVPASLIIGHNQNHIGMLSGRNSSRGTEAEYQQQSCQTASVESSHVVKSRGKDKKGVQSPDAGSPISGCRISPDRGAWYNLKSMLLVYPLQTVYGNPP